MNMFVSNAMIWPDAIAQRLHLHLFGAAGGVEYRAFLPMLSTKGENGQVLGSDFKFVEMFAELHSLRPRCLSARCQLRIEFQTSTCQGFASKVLVLRSLEI